MSLCEILYTSEYADTMASLRDFLERKVYTLEALELTSKALDLLASHYTTWHYRFDIVKHLGLDLFAELDWCEEVALDNEKNYQIWNYRQLIVSAILALPNAARFDPHRENPVMAVMLDLDPKNHHVWAYRKWLVERCDRFGDADEMAYVEAHLARDVRNNSAWVHRFFLVFGAPALEKGPDAAVCARERQFAEEKINLCPQNPLAWTYLRGAHARSGAPLADLRLVALKYVRLGETPEVESTFALEMLAAIAEAEGDVEAAKGYFGLLAETYDPIRANYWAYRANKCN